MAMVIDPCTQVTYVFVDREYTRGKMQVHFSAVGAGTPALSFDDLEAEAIGTFGTWVPGATWAAIQALSDCPMTAASLGVAFHEADPALSAGAGEAEMKGNFQFEDANGEFLTLTVPGILDAVLQGNGRGIDPANAAVAAFVTAFLDQTGNADIRTINNVVPTRLAEGWKTHRESSKSGSRRAG